VRSLVRHILQKDPTARPSMEQILSEPMLAERLDRIARHWPAAETAATAATSEPPPQAAAVPPPPSMVPTSPAGAAVAGGAGDTGERAAYIPTGDPPAVQARHPRS